MDAVISFKFGRKSYAFINLFVEVGVYHFAVTLFAAIKS
jgi:hypothetical protein